MACGACNKKSNVIPNTVFYKRKPHYTVSEWVFVDELGKEFKADDKDKLIALIVQYRHENKLADIPYLSDVVETFTLLSDDRHAPYREQVNINVVVPQSVVSLMAGAWGYFKTALKGEAALVEANVAERRGSVCLNCPFNRDVVNGYTVHAPSLAQSKFCQLKGFRRVSMENGLKICTKCTCINSCKVWFKKSVIKEASTDTIWDSFKGEWIGLNGRPMKCWIVDETVE